MKGAYCQSLGSISLEYFPHPLFHLAGGFVGKGDGGDIAGVDAAFVHQIGNFLRNYTGFTATGTGKY